MVLYLRSHPVISLMRCLVTGGAGFIGSHIVEHLLKKGYEVVCYDLVKNNINLDMHHNLELVKGDIEDKEHVKKVMEGVDIVFHEAAMVSVVESMKNPVKAIKVNTIGTFNVLCAAKDSDVRKVILASSAAVYGNSPELPKKEDMPLSPLSPYAISKLDGEYAARIFYEEYGLKTTCLRYFNVYGPRQDPTSPYAAVIPIFINKALKNECLPIYGDGTQTRDFIFVEDVVRANMLVMNKGDGKVFNVASGVATSINQLAEKIINITESESKVVYKEPRAGDIKHSLADITEISRIGFRPEFDLNQGLKVTMEWFRSKAFNG